MQTTADNPRDPHCCQLGTEIYTGPWRRVSMLTNIKHFEIIEVSVTSCMCKVVHTHTHTHTLHMVFAVTLFIIAKIWKQPRCPSEGEGINCCTSRQGNVIQHKKEMNYQAIRKHGGILNAYD
jgi:hypothetical protein